MPTLSRSFDASAQKQPCALRYCGQIPGCSTKVPAVTPAPLFDLHDADNVRKTREPPAYEFVVESVVEVTDKRNSRLQHLSVRKGMATPSPHPALALPLTA